MIHSDMYEELDQEKGSDWPGLDIYIPHICHFFTQAKFLENKIYTEKRQFFALNL